MKSFRLPDAFTRTLSLAVLTVMVLAVGIGTASNKPEKNDSSKQIVAVAAAAAAVATTHTKTLKTTSTKHPETKRASRSFARLGVAPKSFAARQVWVKRVLWKAGFRGKELRTAWAVVMRESRGNPKSHNKNRRTGDNSYGLFQINMIGNLGYERRAKYDLNSNQALFDPLTNARIAYRMTNGGKNWSSWGIGKGAYNGNRNEPAYRRWLSQYPN